MILVGNSNIITMWLMPNRPVIDSMKHFVMNRKLNFPLATTVVVESERSIPDNNCIF